LDEADDVRIVPFRASDGEVKVQYLSLPVLCILPAVCDALALRRFSLLFAAGTFSQRDSKMPQLTLDTIFERPQFVRFQSGYRLAALTKLCYLYNKEAEDGWLSLPNAAFQQWLGANWRKRLEETQADGFAQVEIGDEQTRWQPRPRFLTETEAAEPVAAAPVHTPRPRYPSDERPRRQMGSDSASTPQPTPQDGRSGSALRSTRTPPPSVSETDSETEDIYKNSLVSETVSETAERTPQPTPQNGKGNHHTNIQQWRETNERLAKDSANVLDDCSSLGFHILAWNHARKVDKHNGNDALFRELKAILFLLEQEQQRTGTSQGAAWFASVTELFEAKGYPLPGKPPPKLTDAEKAALKADLEGGT
jgi:hypothetical protein